jgi:PD-(D/E)XK nuclease superfamily
MPAKLRRTFFPTALTTYELCPERYFHQYVEKRPIRDDFFVPALERGRAIHRVLYDAALEYMEHESLPSDIPARAAIALKRARYASDEEWREDLSIVIRDIEFGLGQFDGTAQVLAAERKYYRKFDEEEPFFVLEAKVDLVLLRVDEDGLLFLDVVDFKSGTGTPNPVQEIMCKIVVEHNAKRFRVPFNYVRSTTVRTGKDDIEAVVLDGEEFDYFLLHVKTLVKAILKDESWRPIQSHRCSWCPFEADGCSLASGVKGTEV